LLCRGSHDLHPMLPQEFGTHLFSSEGPEDEVPTGLPFQVAAPFSTCDFLPVIWFFTAPARTQHPVETGLPIR
jgi:hypothetical protein